MGKRSLKEKLNPEGKKHCSSYSLTDSLKTTRPVVKGKDPTPAQVDPGNEVADRDPSDHQGNTSVTPREQAGSSTATLASEHQTTGTLSTVSETFMPIDSSWRVRIMGKQIYGMWTSEANSHSSTQADK